jgi:uncharacterized protein with HEPN domain
MSTRLLKHLADAEAAAGLALEFIGGLELAEYRASALVRSAVERQVEVVGEAFRRALNEDEGLRERLPDAALAVAIRNRIAHGYDSIDDAIVHETVSQRFAGLRDALRREMAARGG